MTRPSNPRHVVNVGVLLDNLSLTGFQRGEALLLAHALNFASRLKIEAVGPDGARVAITIADVAGMDAFAAHVAGATPRGSVRAAAPLLAAHSNGVERARSPRPAAEPAPDQALRDRRTGLARAEADAQTALDDARHRREAHDHLVSQGDLVAAREVAEGTREP